MSFVKTILTQKWLWRSSANNDCRDGNNYDDDNDDQGVGGDDDDDDGE